MSDDTQETRANADAKEGCTLPPPIKDKSFLSTYTLTNAANEHSIREYVEWQAKEETVEHVEKIKSERVFDREYQCWDVHTDKNRWWVITNPTNLYSQEHFPSLDYTLSFHVGLMARVAAREVGKPQEGRKLRLSAVWRRWEEASEALSSSEESEEFQAVGMRCRECLIHLVRAVGNDEMVAAGDEAPKRSDVIGWSELIANAIARGSSEKDIRGFLKIIASQAWQLSNWLTHKSDAAPADASFVVDVVQTAISTFGTAVMRFESGAPERCPRCGSYRIAVGYNPELSPQYIASCEKCEWATDIQPQLREQLEAAQQALAQYHCPACNSELVSRSEMPVSDCETATLESFECGLQLLDGLVQRPCPAHPNFPKLEDYELRLVPTTDSLWPWFCMAIPTTDAARMVSINTGVGKTKEEAEKNIKDSYSRIAHAN